MEVDFHFIQEKATKKEIQLENLYTEEQVRSFFTKAVAKKQLLMFFPS